jgi:NAD dependent epimerase/dehydratase family enzyme
MSTTGKKRIVVAGATGNIGKALSRRVIETGYELVVFSRNPDSAREIVPGAAEYVAWKPEEQGLWAAAIDGAYAVVHLAGAPFFTRWKNMDYKREINDSRLYGTRGLIKAMREAKAKPEVFIYGSSVGYYGFENTNRDMKMDEIMPAGNDFWGKDSKMLEEEAAKAEELGVRSVILRTGILLSEDSGPLPGQVPSLPDTFSK